MQILVFLAGTTLMHANAVGKSREERVQQVRRGEDVKGIATYVPVGEAALKLQTWQRQGAELLYLSPGRRIEQTPTVLAAHHFPAGPVIFRAPDETWQDVVARARPDILIEDDCESIGGEPEMTFPQLQPGLQASITSIVVREFGGIDHLPDDLAALKAWKNG
jgi:hypothetical protein